MGRTTWTICGALGLLLLMAWFLLPVVSTPGSAPVVSPGLTPASAAGLEAPPAVTDGSGEERSAVPRPPLVLNGEIRLYDWDGGRLDVAGGTMTFTIDSGPVEVAWIVDGRWTSTVEAGVLRVGRLSVGGHVLALRRREFTVDNSDVLIIEADVQRGTGLRVVDRDNGSELSGIVVVPVRGLEQMHIALPPDSALKQAFITNGTSPLALPYQIQDAGLDYWVGAPPDYAWRTITVAGGGPGRTRTVSLARAGKLVVLLEDVPSDTRSVVFRTARRPHDVYARKVGRPGEVVTIAGIASGTYVGRLEAEDARLLDERRITIVAGEVTEIPWVTPRATAKLQGSLFWPPQNAEITPHLELYRRDLTEQWRLVGSGTDLHQHGSSYDWSFGIRPRGQYLLVVQPTQQDFSITHDGWQTDHRWSLVAEVASPVTVHVSSEDQALRTDIRVYWSRIEALYPEMSAADLGTFECMAVPGDIKVYCDGTEAEFKVEQGPNDFFIEAPQFGAGWAPIEVGLRFEENGVTIPVDAFRDLWRPGSARTVSGPGSFIGVSGSMSGGASRTSTTVLRFSGPGVYMLQPLVFEGYKPCRPVRIDLADAQPNLVIDVSLVPDR
jgi:hypothetical protein